MNDEAEEDEKEGDIEEGEPDSPTQGAEADDAALALFCLLYVFGGKEIGTHQDGDFQTAVY